MALIHIAVSAGGHTGSLFERFIHGTDPYPEDTYKEDRPNATAADKLARSIKVPHSILQHANVIWRKNHPNTSYSGTHHAMDPGAYFEQHLGLVISKSILSYLMRAHNLLSKLKSVSCMENKHCKCCNMELPHQNSTVTCKTSQGTYRTFVSLVAQANFFRRARHRRATHQSKAMLLTSPLVAYFGCQIEWCGRRRGCRFCRF